MATRIGLGFSVPNLLFGVLVQNYAKQAIQLREKFDKSLEVDRLRREEIVSEIRTKKRVEALFQNASRGGEAEALFTELVKERKGSGHFVSSFGLAVGELRVDHRVGKGWGHVEVPVRANWEEVTAFLYDYEGRASHELRGKAECSDPWDEEALKKVVRRTQNFKGFSYETSGTLTVHSGDNDDEVFVMQQPVLENLTGIGRIRVITTPRAALLFKGNRKIKGKERAVARIRREGASKCR